MQLNINLPTWLGGSPKQPNSGQNLEALISELKTNPKNAEIRKTLAKMAAKDPVNFMVSLIRNQTTLYSKEIATWKMARREAMDIYNPHRVLLNDLYKDIELDGFISGIVTNRRILKISNKRIKVVNKAGEEQPEKSLYFNRKWFNDFLKYAMQSRFHGYSLVYFPDRTAKGEFKSTKLVYREHVIPIAHRIVQRVYDAQGSDYTLPPYNNFVLGIGDEEDLGIFEKAAPLYILKKHSWANWDQFEEMFGIPIRIAKTASQDKKVIAQIESWLQNMGAAAYGIFPEGTDMDVKENSQTDAFKVFYEKIQTCNSELEVLITGQNRITQKGGSYAKETVAQDDTDEVTDDDKTFNRYVINDMLIPLMIANGYKFDEGDTGEWADEKETTPQEAADLLKIINDMGFVLDQTQVEKLTGIKILGTKAPEVPAPGVKEKKPKEPISAYDEFIQLHTKINELYHPIIK